MRITRKLPRQCAEIRNHEAGVRKIKLFFPLMLLPVLCLTPFIRGVWGTENTTPVLGYTVLEKYPHDPGAFTQGLVIEDGILYEGTGLRGRSSLRRVDIRSGEVVQLQNMPERFFGEGITVFGDNIIQLTWKSRTGFVYSRKSFDLLQVFNYSGEGWGITDDGRHLLMSDGTSEIRFLDPATFKETKRIRVTDNGQPVPMLNELEYIEDKIYANVWKTDRIAIIDPATGVVTAWLDLAGLLPEKIRGEVKDLNGIAYDDRQKALYVTGKLWPALFRIEVISRENK